MPKKKHISKIDDINSILAIISANETKQETNILSLNNLQKLTTKRTYKRFATKFLYLKKILLLPEYADPYDLIYENYWKHIF